MHLPLPAVVGAHDQQRRSGGQPVHAGDQRVEALAHRLVLDDHDIALLQVALARRRQGGGAQLAQQRRVDRLAVEITMRAMLGHARERLYTLDRGRSGRVAETAVECLV
jgi:hypothetical protein